MDSLLPIFTKFIHSLPWHTMPFTFVFHVFIILFIHCFNKLIEHFLNDSSVLHINEQSKQTPVPLGFYVLAKKLENKPNKYVNYETC